MVNRFIYSITVFLGAFLLFQVQPMLSKALLPHFGGSYLVWGGCMVFYQGLLLLGYIYAHFVQRWFGVRGYARWHWVALALPLLFFPFDFAEVGRGTEDWPLVGAIFYQLLRTVSLPFLALSTVSLILQRWYPLVLPGRSPYVLYSASNLGSMAALLSYPVLIEPALDLPQQGSIWWALYALLVVLHLFCRPRGATAEAENIDGRPATPVSRGRMTTWMLLSAAGSATSLSVTNVVTFDLASVPFLWILPLSVYLLTFVLVFRERMWCPRWMSQALIVAIAVGVVTTFQSKLRLSLPGPALLIVQMLVLFVVCLNCHAELVRRRPDDDRQLTTFYIVMALGGFLGSLLVSWVVPLVSTTLLEYPIALVLVALAFAVAGTSVTSTASRRLSTVSFVSWAAVGALAVTGLPWLLARRLAMPVEAVFSICALPLMFCLLRIAISARVLAGGLAVVFVAMSATDTLVSGDEVVHRRRNYYGIYHVFDQDGQRFLQHGTTAHGRQYLDPERARTPISYYHPVTPSARVLSSGVARFENIGMIGLGPGALACYAGPGSRFTIYELDPDNLPIARKYFTYLDVAEANGTRLAFKFGDGRINLRDVARGTYDLFVLDAFNSGSIPVHLLTVEALSEYFRVLRPDGLLLLHVSNKVLDLVPVIESGVRSLGRTVCVNEYFHDERIPDADHTLWMAVTTDAALLEVLKKDLGWTARDTPEKKLPAPWTDQYSNLLSALF